MALSSLTTCTLSSTVGHLEVGTGVDEIGIGDAALPRQGCDAGAEPDRQLAQRIAPADRVVPTGVAGSDVP